MREINLFIILLTGLTLFSCQNDDDTIVDSELDAELESMLKAVSTSGMQAFVMPESNDFANIPQDPNNPITSQKVELGKLLYHETGLAINPENVSGAGNYACASCHFAEAGFQAGRFQGIGEGGVGFGINGEGRQRSMLYTEDQLDVQPIRTPSAMNAAYQELMLWNGQFGATGDNIGTESKWTEGTPIETNELGFEGIETQAIAGLGVHRLDMNMELINNSVYKEMFDKAFASDSEEERFSLKNAGLAIAAYERTLLANKSPFQRWLKGERTAMSEAEKRGAVVFFSQGNCGTCHKGPGLSSMRFDAYGMGDLFECGEDVFKSNPENKENKGRGGFTGRDADMFKFKVPQLYNLKDSPFYGHGSSFRSIEEVIRYKNNGVAQNPNVPEEQLSIHFKPLNLTEDEIADMIAFIETGLYDPDLDRYVPESLPSGQCFPFNDPVARAELDCD